MVDMLFLPIVIILVAFLVISGLLIFVWTVNYRAYRCASESSSTENVALEMEESEKFISFMKK